MTAEKLYSMEEARELYARGIVMNWDAAQWPAQREFVGELTAILKPFRGGQCPVSIEYVSNDAKASIQLGDDWRVKPSDELLIRLRRFLPAEAVLVKYR
ncbi:MAG: hypothetical protein LUQ11_12200, partial [Methylococcaceae bacterium]|nr:hypothetical protein [Methylococcaceae bacterium]